MSYSSRELSYMFYGHEQSLEGKLAQADADLKGLEERRSAAAASRDAGYAVLAQLYLDKPDDAFGNLSDLSKSLHALLDQRSARAAELVSSLGAVRLHRDELRTALSSATQKAQEAAEILAKTTAEAEAAMAGEPDGAQIVGNGRDATAARMEQEQALKLTDIECGQKRAAFQTDPIFAYLVRSNYGTPAYARVGVFAAGDAWLARIVDWPENFRRYTLLGKLVPFIQARLETLKALEAGALAQVAILRKAAQAKLGVPALDGASHAAQAEVERITKELAQAETTIAGLEAEKNAIDDHKDPMITRAKAQIREVLEHEGLTALRARAAKTPSPEDDGAVERIAKAEAELASLDFEVQKQRDTRRSTWEDLNNIRSMRAQFERDFSSGRYRYSRGFDLDSLILGYLAGNVTEAIFWSELRGAQVPVWQAPTYSSSGSSNDGWGGGSGGGFFGGGGDSGGFSGGGGGGGSSFDGGGGGGGSSFDGGG